MNRALRKRITFANHNLVSDGVFSEVHLILCRNVMIYLGPDLQRRVIHLLRIAWFEEDFSVWGAVSPCMVYAWTRALTQ